MHYYSRPHKEQFREAVEFVVRDTHHYEDSVVIGYVWNPAYLNYYFGTMGSAQRVQVVAGRKEDILRLNEYLQMEHPDYIWYISAHRKPSPRFIKYLGRRFTLLDHAPFVHANVWLYRNY